MAIPITSVQYIEVHALGVCAAGGSNSRNVNNIFHWRRTTLTGTINKTNIAAKFNAVVMSQVLAALNIGYTQTGISVRFIDDATDAPAEYAYSGVGTITGDRMSTVLAVFQLMRTALRGRSYRGSKHYFPLSESDTTSGSDDLLNTAALARWTAVATAIQGGFTDLDLNTYVPCIVSRKLSQLVINPTTVISNDVVNIETNKRIGRMRHREVKSVY